MINILTNYTHILKTDTDTFITPSFKSYFLEEIVYIGKGKYVNDNFTKKQIKDYAIKNNYNHKNIHNIGATWFGKCSDIIKIGYLSYKINKQWIEDCQNNMDQFDWKGWPSFYDGVISMYSSEIAINHLEIPFKLEPNLLDFPSSSNNNINDYAHIHCYHNKDFFSKFESYTNNYLPIVENKIYSDISKINNFCLHISKITNTIKNNNIIKNLFNIPHILWINLDRSKIRYDNMKKIFNEYKLSNTRISGIDGKNEKYNNLVSKYGYPYFVTISHLKALHYFINNIDEDYCIICEDDLDINIVNYWDKTLNDYIKELPVTWEIFKLYTGNFINKKLINYSDEKSYGTVIYIIKKEGAKKIYNYYNNIILENLTYNNFHNNIIDLKIYNICETYVKPLFNFKLFNSLSNLTDSYSKEPCDIHNKINKLWGVK